MSRKQTPLVALVAALSLMIALPAQAELGGIPEWPVTAEHETLTPFGGVKATADGRGARACVDAEAPAFAFEDVTGRLPDSGAATAQADEVVGEARLLAGQAQGAVGALPVPAPPVQGLPGAPSLPVPALQGAPSLPVQGPPAAPSLPVLPVEAPGTNDLPTGALSPSTEAITAQACAEADGAHAEGRAEAGPVALAFSQTIDGVKALFDRIATLF